MFWVYAQKSSDLKIGELVPNTLSLPPMSGERVPMGTLAEGMVAYLSLDRHLSSFTPDGEAGVAEFSRDSAAYMPDLIRVEPGEPRFFPGRFGDSIFLESSWRHIKAGNQFPQEIANMSGGAAAFTAIGSAKLSKVDGLLDGSALRIDVEEAGGGFATPAQETVPAKRQTISMYVRGSEAVRLEIAARMEGVEKPLGTSSNVLSDAWQRVEVDYALPAEKDTGPWPGKDRTPPIHLESTLNQPGWFQADALMLESHLGYSGRRGASSWTAGNRKRSGERLYLPPSPNAAAGTVAFWVSRLGDIQWRVLFCIDDGEGWKPDLRIDLRDNRRIQLLMGKDSKSIATADLPAPIEVGEWHHFAVVWDEGRGKVYFDGEPLTSGECDQRMMTSRINIGGVAGDSSPALRADMLIDDFALWNRTLNDDEVAALFRREAPLSAGVDTSLLFDDREPVSVFARDQRDRLWPFRINNNGTESISGLVVKYGIDGIFEKEIELRKIPAGKSLKIELPWSPAFLESGEYEMVFRFTGGEVDREMRRKVEIVPARLPEGNAHVIPWGNYSEDLRELGFTAGAISGTSPQTIENITRYGLYTVARINLAGVSEDESERFVNAAGKRGKFDQRAPGPLADIDRKTADLAERLSLLPDIRHVIINCEHQWSWHPDFRPQTVKQVKERFGLDLSKWSVPENRYFRSVHPGGRLAQSLDSYPPIPPDGTVSLSDPFYAYHLWWHGDGVGTEVFLNDRIAVGTRKLAPLAKYIGEPVLRRPSIRAFREMDLVQEWFYYGNPDRAIWVQEATAAAARGSGAQIGGMPQFLFKPGMAAPYGGLPTPEMFREVVWHCLARPMRGLTYWNHWGAIKRGSADNIKTQEEIDTILGEKPTWKEAAAQIKVTGEHSTVFLFIPELREEIRRLHQEDVAPLGALIPRWENAPRRIAVYRSFAGELFNNRRWSNRTSLENMVLSMQIPFDILYDEDFEDNDKLLDNYQLVAIPVAPVITEPAFAQLSEFAAGGGTVLVDEMFKATIPEAVSIDAGTHQTGLTRLAEIEQDLLLRYKDPLHPGYIEGMEQAARQIADELAEQGMEIPKIVSGLELDLSTSTRSVFPNILRAEGVNYLVAVNRLRRPGPHYGHFGKVLEEGVSQTAEFDAAPNLGKVAYDLLNSIRIPMKQQDGRNHFKLELPPGGGRVLIFLPEPVGSMELNVEDGGSTRRGERLRVSASLSGESGQLLPGVIPVRADLTGPDGNELDLSRYDAFVNGEWLMEIPVSFNQPMGTYRLTLTELASGSQVQQTWRIE